MFRKINQKRGDTMIVSEDEAKDKTCPHKYHPGLFVKCEGSDCMAWHWMRDEKTGYCGLSPHFLNVETKEK